ncbi:MAG TPA: alpha/beta hydrolase [Polyangia bacterium]|nr:alpha/beta hydrolase [Polyangia bacterium]
METFFFGDPERPLFGAMHEPPRPSASPRVAVVCAPLWQEGVRAHRVLRQLGVRLVKEGFSTLRFDYEGAGDSAGATEDGEVARWLVDVGRAVDEAKRRKNVARVTLVGLRFGATLAALAAAARDDVERLVLWEPIVEGPRFLEEAGAEHRAWRDTYLSWRKLAPAAVDDGVELLGFPITEAMRRSIASVDLTAAIVPAGVSPRVLVVEREASAGPKLRARFGGNARVDHEIVAEPEVWKFRPLESAPGGRKTLDVIATWAARGDA